MLGRNGRSTQAAIAWPSDRQWSRSALPRWRNDSARRLSQCSLVQPSQLLLDSWFASRWEEPPDTPLEGDTERDERNGSFRCPLSPTSRSMLAIVQIQTSSPTGSG